MSAKHEVRTYSGGSGEMGWMQNICTCGWEGQRFYAYDDYQRTNLREENTTAHILQEPKP